jgi:formate dehydrogenase subunit gamma
VSLAEQAIVRARTAEDIAVGDELVRHRLSSRVIHWGVGVLFLVCLLSGLPIWTPVFGWMAGLLGGLAVCRVLHPWAGLLFFASAAAMFVHWLKDMRLTPKDWEWFGPKVLAYVTYAEHDDEVGKYNGGQKLFFFAASLGSVGFLVSGLVLWWPESFPQAIRLAGILLHDLTFILFAVAVVLHIYLPAAQPGTYRAMIRGTVTGAWARLHHPRWFREVTNGDAHRS